LGNFEGLAHRDVVVPVVQSAQNAAKSDVARIAGNEIRPGTGVGENTRNAELIELQLVVGNLGDACRENAIRRAVVIGIELSVGRARDGIASAETEQRAYLPSADDSI